MRNGNQIRAALARRFADSRRILGISDCPCIVPRSPIGPRGRLARRLQLCESSTGAMTRQLSSRAALPVEHHHDVLGTHREQLADGVRPEVFWPFTSSRYLLGSQPSGVRCEVKSGAARRDIAVVSHTCWIRIVLRHGLGVTEEPCLARRGRVRHVVAAPPRRSESRRWPCRRSFPDASINAF